MDLRTAALWTLCIIAALSSVVSVIITVSDKSRAKKNKTRIREATFFLFAALGGALAMLLAMLTVRHKTKHARFMAGLPAIILFQALTVYLILT
ncbi:MAG: DUF1294 domain-containing protein [Clostridia bacterium]|nr:DUF1294 domain-containing protein [Clostridia bacterium]